MTVLVPTDFSNLSKVAAQYAIGVAKKLKADVILLAVVDMNASAATSLKWKMLENEMVKIAKQDGEQLMREIKETVKGKFKISFQYRVGYPVQDVVNSFAIENEADLIVMGTKGATGLKKVVMGSNAAAIIDKSVVPVIAVPAETVYRPVRQLVYATDLRNLHEEVKTVAMFASLFDAHVKVLHVVPENSNKQLNIEEYTAELIKQTRYKKLSFHVFANNQVSAEVDRFVTSEKTDMLAMFTHKLGFYEKMFGKSVTRQLAFHAHVPLLTFNKTTIL